MSKENPAQIKTLYSVVRKHHNGRFLLVCKLMAEYVMPYAICHMAALPALTSPLNLTAYGQRAGSSTSWSELTKTFSSGWNLICGHMHMSYSKKLMGGQPARRVICPFASWCQLCARLCFSCFSCPIADVGLLVKTSHVCIKAGLLHEVNFQPNSDCHM